MNHYALDFVPPLLGFDSLFNTIRIGVKWARLLKADDIVYIQDSKSKMIVSKAKVISVETGELGELCLMHADQNHSQLATPDNDSPKRVFAHLRKFHGPHIVTIEKKATVIYLMRVPDGDD